METKNIFQRLNTISTEAKKIPKEGVNTYSKYNYVRAVDVLESMQELMHKHGVYLSLKEIEHSREQKGNNFHTTLKVQATFINMDDTTDRHSVDYYTTSADTLDKDIFKAKTNGLKYLFTQQFLLITEDVKDTEDSANIEKNLQATAKNVFRSEGNGEASGNNPPKSPNASPSYPKYGICVCGSPISLSKNKKNLYCSGYKKGCDKFPYTLYSGQPTIPENITTHDQFLKWQADQRELPTTNDIPF